MSDFEGNGLGTLYEGVGWDWAVLDPGFTSYSGIFQLVYLTERQQRYKKIKKKKKKENKKYKIQIKNYNFHTMPYRLSEGETKESNQL